MNLRRLGLLINVFVSVSGDYASVYTISCLCIEDNYKTECKRNFQLFLDDKFYISWNKIGNFHNEKYLQFLDMFFKEKYFKSFVHLSKKDNVNELYRQILRIIVEAMSNYPFEKFKIFIRPINGMNVSQKLKRIFLSDSIPFQSIEELELRDSRFMQLAGIISGFYLYAHSSDFGCNFHSDCGKDYLVKTILEKNTEPKIVIFD